MANTSYEIYIVHYDEFYCITELKGKNNKNIDSIVEHIKEYGNSPIDVGSEGGPEEGLYHVEVIKHYYNRWWDDWDRQEFPVYPERDTEGLPKYVDKIVDEIYSRLTV